METGLEWWLMSVILVTREVKIGKNEVQNSPGRTSVRLHLNKRAEQYTFVISAMQEV
jgi:hypothetical protein